VNRHLTRSSLVTLLIGVVAGLNGSCYAGDAAAADQWNIMLVPANQTVYSGEARTTFNKYCAPCHSKDGRAQTPVARQRRVRNLSESNASDARIIEQILDGTHNKATMFKMPAFREKLSRAQVESLVPLLKAFRSFPQAPQHQTAGIPRLAGMISDRYRHFAILETAGSSHHYFILRERERHEGVTLLDASPNKGRVNLRVGAANPVVTLTLDGWSVSQPTDKGTAGIRESLSLALNGIPPKLALRKVNLDLVLFLYSQFSGRTIIRSPHLPAALLDLNVGAAGPESMTQGLKRVLLAHGITSIEDGDKFLLVMPESESGSVHPQFRQFEASAADGSWPDLYPGGVNVNLPNTGLDQLVRLYTELTGRKFDSLELPTTGMVNFTTRAPLSKVECVYALETLLRWHGLERVTVAGDPAPATCASLGKESRVRRVSATWRVGEPIPEVRLVVTNAVRRVALSTTGALLTAAVGQSWQEVRLPFRTFLRGLTLGHGLFVAVGGSYVDTPGVILTSTDGARWRVRHAGTGENLYAVTFGGNRWVAVGDSGVIWTSKNGTRWQRCDSGSVACLFRVSYHDGLFIATGEYNATVTSKDGSCWMRQTTHPPPR
jgi:mono/diheme cytochrome c family protein